MSGTLNEAIKALESAISELNEYSKSRDPMLLRMLPRRVGSQLVRPLRRY